jgi:hypothetical protein
MERIPGYEALRKRAPEVRVTVGTAGLLTMGSLAVMDSEERQDILETTDVTPFSMNKIVTSADKVGIGDQAVFVALTVLFGAFALRGVAGIHARRDSSGS